MNPVNWRVMLSAGMASGSSGFLALHERRDLIDRPAGFNLYELVVPRSAKARRSCSKPGSS